MDEAKILEAMARAAYERERDIEKFGLPWEEMIPAFQATRIESQRAAWAAAKEAVAEAGLPQIIELLPATPDQR